MRAQEAAEIAEKINKPKYLNAEMERKPLVSKEFNDCICKIKEAANAGNTTIVFNIKYPETLQKLDDLGYTHYVDNCFSDQLKEKGDVLISFEKGNVGKKKKWWQ